MWYAWAASRSTAMTRLRSSSHPWSPRVGDRSPVGGELGIGFEPLSVVLVDAAAAADHLDDSAVPLMMAPIADAVAAAKQIPADDVEARTWIRCGSAWR